MKQIFVYIMVLTSIFTASGQINEVGIFLGGTNYIGDVGSNAKRHYVKPNELGFGVLYKWNKSIRHSFRFAYTHGKLTANDIQSSSPSRFKRKYDFENTVDEFMAALEFNFFDFDLHESDFAFTPFVASGVSYFFYNEIYRYGQSSRTDLRNSQFALPMIVGVKAQLFTNFVLAAEVGFRYAFTDNLDMSNPKSEAFAHLRFGNIKNNDWYVFTGFTLTYTFGQNPCYCAQ